MAETGDPGELAALVATLLPGDGSFPNAATIGVHGVVAGRLRTLRGPAAVDELMAALVAAGGPLAGQDASGRQAVVAQLEAAQPDLFLHLRMATYLAYYEQPLVVAAVRGLGFVYNDAPLPRGYDLEPFDPEIDAPRHNRGHYVPTEDVRRVDLSGLDFLAGERR